MLRQFGLAALPVKSAPLSLDAEFNGAVAKGGKLELKGSVAGIALSYDGETTAKDGKPVVDGTFSAAGDDIDPALLLAGLGLPGIGEGHGAYGLSNACVQSAVDDYFLDGTAPKAGTRC